MNVGFCVKKKRPTVKRIEMEENERGYKGKEEKKFTEKL
jgi:hypothetical protein